MTSDNIANLKNFKIQLQQVETGLASDPDNEDLKKLHHDLNEVIQLTITLMSPEELAALENENEAGENSRARAHHYKAGDHVLAPLSEDGQFYEAVIEDITSDGQCTVVFSHQKRRLAEVCLVELLKPLGGNKKYRYNNSHHTTTSKSGGNGGGSNSGDDSESSNTGSGSGTAGGALSFKRTQEMRDAAKRKKQKRNERLKELEEEREKDKMKWQSFSSKVMSKKMKGNIKKSIFATPDSVNGRVGVGTCGVGGKPMTEYQMKMEKVQKTSTALPKLSLASGEDVSASIIGASSSSSKNIDIGSTSSRYSSTGRRY